MARFSLAPLSMSLLLGALLGSLPACGGGGTGLVGLWKHQIRYTNLFSEQWRFEADGRFTYDSYLTGREHIAGTYEVSGGLMRTSGESQQLRTTIEREWTLYQAGDRLVVAAGIPEGAARSQANAAGTFVARFAEGWPSKGYRSEWVSRYVLAADGAAEVTRTRDGVVYESQKGSYLRFGEELIQMELRADEASAKAITLHELVDGAVLAEEATVFGRY